MEQMAALVMLAFTIGFLTGEALRDELYGAPTTAQTDPDLPQTTPDTPHRQGRRKWQLYSGLFILLKRKIALADERVQELHDQVVAAFAQLVQPLPVRT
jgi:hypothetical protein